MQLRTHWIQNYCIARWMYLSSTTWQWNRLVTPYRLSGDRVGAFLARAPTPLSILGSRYFCVEKRQSFGDSVTVLPKKLPPTVFYTLLALLLPRHLLLGAPKAYCKRNSSGLMTGKQTSSRKEINLEAQSPTAWSGQKKLHLGISLAKVELACQQPCVW